MKPLPYCPAMDGLPGIFPGTMTVIIETDDETPVNHTPNEDNLREVDDGPDTDWTLSRRMLKR